MADVHAAPPDVPGVVPGVEAEPVTRSLGRTVVISVAVGVALGVIVFFLIAIPFYTLASFEPDGGLDRPIVRTGLFRIALPVGAVAGLVGGVATGRWWYRGGRLVDHQSGDRYSNR